MTTGFVKHFVLTGSDGHDFFPYRDWASEHNRAPNRNEIVEFIDSFVECWEQRTDTPRYLAASQHALINKYHSDPDYRNRVIDEAVEYILDVDWDEIIETDDV